MKYFIGLFLTLFIMQVHAQTANIRDIPVDDETNIAITKGELSQRSYEIHKGSADVEGEPALLAQEARQAWKKACDDWKTETKSMNNDKDDHVIAINCNSPTCTKAENATTICKSTGRYSVKSKIK